MHYKFVHIRIHLKLKSNIVKLLLMIEITKLPPLLLLYLNTPLHFSRSSQSTFLSNINAVLPDFLKSSILIAKILNFKTIFIPANTYFLSMLKDPKIIFDFWGIYNITCQWGLSYICKLNVV